MPLAMLNSLFSSLVDSAFVQQILLVEFDLYSVFKAPTLANSMPPQSTRKKGLKRKRNADDSRLGSRRVRVYRKPNKDLEDLSEGMGPLA